MFPGRYDRIIEAWQISPGGRLGVPWGVRPDWHDSGPARAPSCSWAGAGISGEGLVGRLFPGVVLSAASRAGSLAPGALQWWANHRLCGLFSWICDWRVRIRRQFRLWRRSFDHTRGYPGEGPKGLSGGGSTRGRKGGPNSVSIRIGSANITSWRSFRKEFDLVDSPLRGFQVLAVQEHRLVHERQLAQAQAWLKARGWKSHMLKAEVGPGGRPSGGVGWLWQEWVPVCQVGRDSVGARAVAIGLRSPRIGRISLWSLYGWSGHEDRTLALLDTLVARGSSAGLPWGIFGDFNVPAGTVRGWCGSIEGGSKLRVLSPGPTCFAGAKGSAIDFGVVDKLLAAWLWSGCTLETGLATHRPVRWDLRWAWWGQVKVLKGTGKVSLERRIGPALPPPSAAEDQLRRDVAWASLVYGGSVTQGWAPGKAQQAALEGLLQSWQACARSQARFIFGLGEGDVLSVPDLVGGPLLCTTEDPAKLVKVRAKMAEKSHRAQATRWCVRRLQEAAEGVRLHQAGKWRTRWAQRLDSWISEGTLRPWMRDDFMEVWLEAPNWGLVQAAAVSRVEKYKRLLGEDEREERLEDDARWKAFEEDVKQGKSVAFRAVKDKIQEVWSGEDEVSNVALLEGQAEKWSAIWQAGRSAWDVRQAGISVGGLDVGAALTASDLRKAAKSFKKKTTAVEGWHPRHLAAFSDELLELLGGILRLFEVAVWWPSSESCLLTKLIPKPKGGLRPVMWFRTLYRVYARARRDSVQRWFKEWTATRPEINMAPGRHTTDAIWRSMVRQDLGTGAKKFVEVNWDFQKAFDFVDRRRLWDSAARHGYPMGILAASLNSYGWSRRVLLNSEVSDEIWARLGIAAGSPFAPYELAVHLADLVDMVRQWNLEEPLFRATLSIHVDDVAITMEALVDTPGLAEAMARLAKRLADHIKAIGMRLDLGDKAFVLASDPGLLRRSKRLLGELGGVAAVGVRKLGVDYGMCSAGRKFCQVRRGRLASGVRRFGRLRAMKLHKKGTRVVAAGIIPHVAYGLSLYAPSKGEVRRLKAATGGQGAVRRPLGVLGKVVAAAGSPSMDIEFISLRDPLLRWCREVWLLGAKHRSADGLSPVEVVAAARILEAGRPRQGPLAAVARSLQVLGWRLEDGGGTLVGVAGAAGNTSFRRALQFISPSAVGRLAWERWQALCFQAGMSRIAGRIELLGGDTSLWSQQLVVDLLRTKDFGPHERALAAQAVSAVLPTASWLKAHGWLTDGLCSCGQEDTLAHRLAGCSAGAPCPVEGLASFRDLFSMLVAPALPARRHPDGFAAAWVDGCMLPAEEDIQFEAGSTVYSDGSVMWPRWAGLATGGYSVVSTRGHALLHGFAESADSGWPQQAGTMELLALWAAVERAPASGCFRIGSDCQMVVGGFARLDEVADDYKGPLAGMWRRVRCIRQGLAEGVRVEVFKVKAHRQLADVPDSQLGAFFGNAVADTLAKQAATDRTSMALADIAAGELEASLARLRRFVRWAGTRSWPDGKSLGRAPGLGPVRVACGLRVPKAVHEWVWAAERWWCQKCGCCSRGRASGKCRGVAALGGAHPSHKQVLCHLASEDGPPLHVCVACGGTRTAGKGLRGRCLGVGGGAAGGEIRRRRRRVASGLHPYSNRRIVLVSPWPFLEAGTGAGGGGPSGCTGGAVGGGAVGGGEGSGLMSGGHRGAVGRGGPGGHSPCPPAGLLADWLRVIRPEDLGARADVGGLSRLALGLDDDGAVSVAGSDGPGIEDNGGGFQFFGMDSG